MNAIVERLRTQDRAAWWFGASGLTLPFIAGLATGEGHGLLVFLLCAAVVASVVAIYNWRWSVYALLLYVPFSGLPIIALYPNTGPPNLIKDVLFVLPAYLGFMVYLGASKRQMSFPGAPLVPMALLAVLVLVQALNPSLPNHLVGVIGIKIWLLYLPLYFLGYHLVETKAELFRMLGLMTAVALAPAIVGIFEAVLIYGGQAPRVYSWYGAAAAAVSQDFTSLYVTTETGVVSLHRVPSLFSFVTQYFNFLMAMIAISYAWARGALQGTGRSWVGWAAWATILIAAFLSGARSAFVFLPGLVLLMVLLERGLRGAAVIRLSMVGFALLFAIGILGVGFSALLTHLYDLATLEFASVFVDGFRNALDVTWFGLGSGIDSAASRYAVADDQLFSSIGGRWSESWYVKAVLELGVVSLVLVALIFGTILVRGYKQHRQLRDPRLRTVSAALIAFVIWTLVVGVKSQYLDFDPINVYFWLFAGFLAKLSVLDEPPEHAES